MHQFIKYKWLKAKDFLRTFKITNINNTQFYGICKEEEDHLKELQKFFSEKWVSVKWNRMPISQSDISVIFKIYILIILQAKRSPFNFWIGPRICVC